MKKPDLSEIAMFASLPEETLAQLDRDCVWVERETGYVLIDEANSEPHSVFVLADGEVEVFRRGQEGEVVPVGSLKSTACFGEFATIFGKPGSASVRAATDCLLGEIPPDVFLGLVRQHPSVCLPLLEKMIGLVRAFDEELLRRQPRENLIALAYYRYVVLGSL